MCKMGNILFQSLSSLQPLGVALSKNCALYEGMPGRNTNLISRLMMKIYANSNASVLRLFRRSCICWKSTRQLDWTKYWEGWWDAEVELALSLTYLINKSIIDGTVPALWKVALVAPLYKSEDKLLVENFRPFSVLLVLSRVLERKVHTEMSAYLDHSCLLYKPSVRI